MGRGFRRAISAFGCDERASTAVLTALAMVSLVGVTALVVDTSMFFVGKRRLQGAVDMAAALSVTAAPSQALAAAKASLAANGFASATVDVVAGSYTSNQTLAASARFVAGGAPSNAIAVHATNVMPMIFGTVFHFASNATGQVIVGAAATASAVPMAALALGSRLVSVNGGLANALFSALTGSPFALSALDYQSLLSANLDAGLLLRNLAPKLGLSQGTYGDILNAPVTLPQVLKALQGSGLTSGAYMALASVLNGMATGSTFKLGNLLDLGPYDSQAVATTLPLAVTLDAYDVLSGAIALAAAGHEISLDLGATVPGVAGATLIVAVGAPAVRSGVARAGVTTTLSTQQIRIGIAVSVTVPLIATVRLPVVVDVAKAMATTQGPTCASGVAAMTIAVTPSVAEVWIGAATPMLVPPAPVVPAAAPTATLLGLSISAYAHTVSGTPQATSFSLTTADVEAGTIKTASTNYAVATLVATALSNLSLTVAGQTVASTSLPPSLVGLLTTTLGGLAGPASSLATDATNAFGIRIGQADTWVTDLKCGMPTVVQ